MADNKIETKKRIKSISSLLGMEVDALKMRQ